MDKPLWVYANVIYSLDQPITGAGYYYRTYTSDRFVISSVPHLISLEELQAAGVKATRSPSLLIEDFQGEWQKQWFAYKTAVFHGQHRKESGKSGPFVPFGKPDR